MSGKMPASQPTKRQIKEKWHLARSAQIENELRGRPVENPNSTLPQRKYDNPVLDIAILPLFNAYFNSPHHRRELSIYARQTCKVCSGRGFVERDHPNGGVKWTQVCECASKRIAKFQEEEDPNKDENYSQWLKRVKG